MKPTEADPVWANRGLVNVHLDLTPWRSLRIDPLGVKKMSGRVRLRHGLTSGLGGLG